MRSDFFNPPTNFNRRTIERFHKLELVKECQRLEKEGWEPLHPIRENKNWVKMWDYRQNRKTKSTKARVGMVKTGYDCCTKYVVTMVRKENHDAK